ncbi:acyl-CoA dehydrogenase family protein [Kibdelosporangium philippinense]|uniref:acyl-CoA dehydrogenase family protein n=1 Tax=Kibdelosporangium philippinense TaxID=211113 RepID=UPI00361686B6
MRTDGSRPRSRTRDFQAEVRSWLAANVPTDLPSMDTPEGFAAHRAWEKTLFDARLAVVSWPTEFGGRDASLLQWVVFEEEYYAAGAPAR